MFRKCLRAVRSLLRGDKSERELSAELRFHLEMEIDNNVRKGMSLKEARLTAMRCFGGVELHKEECRDVRASAFIDALVQDFRFGLRMLAKQPGFTALSLAVLALGIGANAAIYSVTYGVLLRPLPYQDGSRLVVVRQEAPPAGIHNLLFSVKEIADYRERNQTFAALA